MFITYFLGILPSKKEWLGVLLVIIGIIFMINDPKAERTGIETGSSFLPALIDIGSACFGAFYFLMSAKNVKSMPICLLLLIMNVHTWLMNSLIAKSIEPQIKLFSIDMNYGCLGFLNPGNNMTTLLAYVLFSSFFGSAGYVFCLLFFSPLVTSNAYLIEPFFAQMFGYLLGLDKIPGIMTAFGTSLAIAGIFYIDSGSRARILHQ